MVPVLVGVLALVQARAEVVRLQVLVGVVRVRARARLVRVEVVRLQARVGVVPVLVGVVRLQARVGVVRVQARARLVRVQARARLVRVQARVGVVRLQAQVVRVQAQAVRSPRAVQEGRPARGAGEPAVHRPAVPRRPPWRVATRSPLMGPPRESPRRRSPAALAAVYRPLPVRFQNRRRQASRRRPSRPQRRTRGSFARLPPLGGFELLCRCSQVERLYRRDPGSHRRPLWLRGRRPSRAR